ncbi:DUF4419 domain-containing protein [Podospora aff. communis PSN243]|uniref:DUF4419 domain-containing protein n=1 Tax=Podospora aff. communis PSN243 TaxID=3040156 RepID=A0AAV9GIY1_9PEZI|nr:DUF4419 domain-containing protein [Podospora aff. communis PSN243]
MPVTVRPSTNLPRLVRKHHYKHEPDRRNRFSDICPKEDANVRAILCSSFDSDRPPDPIISSANGFVLGALQAYNNHHHFIIRPDDIWLAILTQLSFCINRNAEALRHIFQPNTDQNTRSQITAISLTALGSPTPSTASQIEHMALALSSALAENLSTLGLSAWATPTFTTSTPTDAAAAAIIMSGAFRSYFNYAFVFFCGMPTVTLQCTKDDWVSLQAKAMRISSIFASTPEATPLPDDTRTQGVEKEIRQFQALLAPVLTHIIQTFESPTDPGVIDFWARMAHESGGSGTHYISGWLTAFCFWDAEGRCLYDKLTDGDGGVEVDTENAGRPGCKLGDVLYHRVESGAIPVGWAGAPVDVTDERGEVCRAMLVAGSMGLRVSSSGERLGRRGEGCLKVSTDANGTRRTEKGSDGASQRRDAEGEVGLDTLQPVVGWWMYEVASEEENGDDYWEAETEDTWVPAGLAARMKAVV